jgi:hypothetical protein
MNKTFKYAISVVLSAAMVTPALAQRDNFPDVADTHWAYEAVARLKKEGIATGFPDGTFQGKRMMTRYEMASLLYALYMNLKNVTDGLGAQITALETRVNGMSSGGGDKVDNSEVQALRDSVASLRKDMSSMKSWGDDITQMKKMSSTYEKELSQMGVDVESMKKDLSDINARVKKLEGGGMSSNVKISGDANFFMGAGFKGTAGNTVINSDGHGFGSTGSGAGIDSLTVLHELGLNISASNVVGELVVGNMLGNGNTGFGNGSSTFSANGTNYNSGNNNTNVYLNRLYATMNDGIGGLNFDAKIGRQGLKLGSFVLQRPDTTTFYSQDRMDNGEYTMDGASFKFGLGANTDLGLFLGQTNNNAGTSGTGIMPMLIGEPQSAVNNGFNAALSVARTMGATLGFKLGENGHLGLSFVDFDSNTLANTPGSNRLEVFGADLGYKLSDSISLMAGTGRSQFKAGTSNVSFGKNTRTNFGVDWMAGSLGLNLGYSEVGSGYVAPGSWSKVAVYHNLNDLKTTSIKGHYGLSDKLTIRGGFVKGDQMSVTNKDAVKSTTLGADFKINSNWTLMADYEDTMFKGGFVQDGATPQFKFTTLGFGYDMGANTMFKMFYQMSDIKGLAPSSNLFPSSTLGAIKGSQIGAQFSVKF